MKSGKPWMKRILITAGIIAIVGVGINWAMERDRSDDDHGKRNTEQSMSVSAGKGWGGPDGHHVRGMDGEGHDHEGWGAGMAVGGTILAAGLLYWTVKRRKRSSAMFAADVTPVTPSTSDFLDQWEKNQTNTKESN
ncbi:hypothetical protein [Cohnella nanjingensis]|uniref:Uncharacterized protein n=1 Tax=Cohnella nanjingensis TaxID=1387779 RepID=A0A7X0VFA3_9BACL|nr:hypothetical protein [Cohnella nanjingensis]MBB6671845.1 hypothetical protein [Cohnella nanjingensis]